MTSCRNSSLKALYPMMLLCFSMQSAWAQHEPAEFGVVSMEELKMQNYPPDPSAQAIILFDKGESLIDLNSPRGTTVKRHVRIKLFNKQAYEDWGTVSMVVERSSLSKLKGASYSLEDGVVVKSELRNDAIFKSRNGKFLDELKFTFPQLREGSVIEYSYAIEMNSHTLPSWSFQSSIPTLWSGYAMTYSGLVFKTDIRGTLKITDYQSKNNGRYHRWVITEVPAFKTEPQMPHQGIYKSTINFWGVLSTWSTFNRNLMNSEAFGLIVAGNNYLKKKAAGLTAGINDPRKKIRVISDYVKQNIAWDGVRDFYGDNPKTVFERKDGSSGDINLILGALLGQADIKVNMVLLSTRSHGFVLEQFPSLSQFNYVVCSVSIDSTTLLLDATEKSLPYDILPVRCLNYDGMVVDINGPQWIKISSKTKAKTSANAEFNMTENGELHGKLQFIRDGYDALDARKEYEGKGKDAYVKNFRSGKSWQIEKSELQNMQDPGKPVAETYEVSISNETTQAGDMMYFNPIVALREDTNPFIVERREYPIDFGIPKERIFVSSFTLPDGYSIEDLPQSKVIKMEDNSAKCTFNISQTGNRLFVMYNLQINKTLFMKEEYPGLREFYTRLVAKMAEQIVLRKKK